MKHFFRTTFIVLALTCAATLSAQPAAESAQATFPPEWEPHEAVWMGWAEDDSTRSEVQVEMIRAMLPQVFVRLLVVSDSARAHAEETLRAAGVETGRVEYVVHAVPNFWTRDPGPLFLSDGRSLAVASFRWDEYAFPNDVIDYEGGAHLRRGEIGPSVARTRGLPVVASDLVAEGGGIEVSSDVLLTYRETALHRNPGVPLEEIEREYLRLYGKEKLVWLSRAPLSDRVFAGPKLANYFGWGANGHIDEYVRFVNDSTVVIAQVDEADAAADTLAAVDRAILLENLRELQAATDAAGRPFQIVTLPVPGLHHFASTRTVDESAKARYPTSVLYRDFEVGDEVRWMPAMSYLNFFITNGVVLVPSYWREGMPEREREKDEEVRATLQRLFPDRRIVQIDPLAVNWWGGGMHCITQQEPRVE